jgi:hypothetical protein
LIGRWIADVDKNGRVVPVARLKRRQEVIAGGAFGIDNQQGSGAYCWHVGLDLIAQLVREVERRQM